MISVVGVLFVLLSFYSISVSASQQCWAKNSWLSTASCVLCTDYVQNQCKSYNYTPCFDTEASCSGIAQSISPSCWTTKGWNSKECTVCPEEKQNQCPHYSYTPCHLSQEACAKSVGAPISPETVSPPQPPVVSPVSPPLPPVVSPPVSPTINNSGSCWTTKGWSSKECVVCPVAERSGQCPYYNFAVCHPSKEACNKSAIPPGSDCSSISCPESTLDIKSPTFRGRPTFQGPSCYNNEYGSQFGPNWKPSKRTSFEKYVKNPTEFYKLVKTADTAMPIMTSTWSNIEGCDGATASYELFVCALELLEATKKVFDAPPRGGLGARAIEFANTGNEESDKLEIAAFFAHKFKEVSRLTLWEEKKRGYTEYSEMYPPVPNQSYHGRGPVQISYNFNYGPFSEWFYGDKWTLLNDPGKVDPDGPLGFIAALWFWFTPRQFTSGAPVAGNIRTRDAIIHWTDGKMNNIYNDGVDYDAVAGFALSTNVINGGIECARGDGESHAWRVAYFLTVASRMGLNVKDIIDKQQCMADKFCNGLFSGCSSSSHVTICQGKETPCGKTYVDGWQNPLCKF